MGTLGQFTEADVDALLSGLDPESRALAVVSGQPLYLPGRGYTEGMADWPDLGVSFSILPSGAAFAMAR